MGGSSGTCGDNLKNICGHMAVISGIASIFSLMLMLLIIFVKEKIDSQIVQGLIIAAVVLGSIVVSLILLYISIASGAFACLLMGESRYISTDEIFPLFIRGLGYGVLGVFLTLLSPVLIPIMLVCIPCICAYFFAKDPNCWSIDFDSDNCEVVTSVLGWISCVILSILFFPILFPIGIWFSPCLIVMFWQPRTPTSCGAQPRSFCGIRSNCCYCHTEPHQEVTPSSPPV